MATVKELKAMFTAETKGIKTAFKQIQQEAAKLSGTTKRTTDDVNKHYNSLITSTEKLGRAIEESGDLDVFDGLNQAIQKAQDEMAETGKVSAATMGELNAAVKGSTEHLDTLGAEARESFGKIEDAIADVNRDFLTLGVDNGLDDLNSDASNSTDSLNDLGAASSDAQSEIQDLGADNALDTLNNDAGQAGGNLDELGDAADAANDDIADLGGNNQLNDLTNDAGNAGGNLNDLGDAANNADQEIDTLGGASQLDQLRSDLETAQRQLQELQDASNQADSEIDTLGGASQLDLLRTDLQNGQLEIQELRDAANAADPAVNNLGQQNQLNELRADLQRAQQEIDDLRTAANQADDEIGDLGGDNNLDELAESSSGLAGVVAGIGGGFLAAASGVLGLVAAGAGIFAFVKSSDELTQAVNSLQVQTGATAEEIDVMKDSLVDVYGSNYGEGFQDIADSMAIVQTATKQTGEELEDTTKKALLLRDSFDLEVGETMKVVSVLMKQFGIDSDEAMTMLAEGAQNGMNFADDMADSFWEYSGYFETLGFTAEEMWTTFKEGAENGAFNLDKVGDAIKEFGIRVIDGSTSTNDALSFLYQSDGFDKFMTNLQNGGTKTKEFMELAGKVGKESATLFLEDMEKGGTAAEKTYKIIEYTMGESGKLMQGMQDGSITGKEAMDEILGKIGEIDDIQTQTSIGVALFGTQWEDLGAETMLQLGSVRSEIDLTGDTLAKIDKIKYNSIGEAFAGMGRMAISEILIPIQDKIMPGINKAVNGVVGFIGTVRDVLKGLASGESTKDIIASYGLEADSFMPAIRAAQLIFEGFSKVRELLQPLGEAVKAVMALFRDEDGTAISILSKLGMSPEQISAIMSAVDSIKSVVNSLVDNVKSAFENGLPILEKYWTTLSETIMMVFEYLYPRIMPLVLDIVEFVVSTFKKIIDFWQTDGQQLLGAIGNLFKGIMAVVAVVMPLVLGIIKMVWTSIKGVINGALNIIMGLVKVFSGLFTGDFAKMWEGVKQLFIGVVEFLWNFIQLTFFGKILGGVKAFVMTFRTFFDDLWRGIVSLFQGGGSSAMTTISVAWQSILRTTKEVFANIGSFLANTWNSIKSIFSGALAGIKFIFSSAWTAIRTATTTSFTAIRTVITTIFGAIQTFFTTALNFYRTLFQNTWGAIFNNVKTIFTNVFNFFKTIFTNILNTLKNIVSTILTNLSTAWTTSFNTVKTIFTNVFNFFKTIFTNILNTLKNITSNILNAIKNTWNSVYNSSKSIFTNVFNFLKTTFTNIYNTISGLVSNVFTKVKGVWTNLKNTTSSIFGSIVSAIKTKFTDIVNAAKALPGRIGDGIGAMASKVTAGVTKVINKLATTLGKGVNGVIGGVNWVLDKIGVDKDIPKWTVPQYAQGTKHNRGAHPGGPMIVGDGKGSNRGPELIETPDGKQMLSPSKPTLMHGEEGTKVWSATETKKILAMVPHYALGDIKGGLRSAGDWVADKYNSGKEKVKAVGSKIKDVAVNAFDYIKSPGKFLDLALKTLGIEKPKGGSFVGDMAVGGWNRVKEEAIGFVKSKLATFGASQSGIALTGGSGGGFGAPFRFTSGPGPRNTGIPGASTFHKGWDWAAPIGTPIPSVTDGVGHRTGFHPLSGNFVEVKTGNKIHRYQHNSKNIMRVGQPVKKGQTVALVGDTGVGSGAHLHYQVNGYEDGGIVDGNLGAQLAWLTEGGWSESVISHDPAKRTSQRAIWEQTGKELGFTGNSNQLEEMIALLKKISDNNPLIRILEEIRDKELIVDGDSLNRDMDYRSGQRLNSSKYMRG